MRIQILILGLIITVTVSPVKIDFPYEVVGAVPTKSESKEIKSFRGIR